MSKINTEFFIARRISSRQGGPKNVMVRIATVTVGVSMAVMIVALAVIYGFKRDITEKLTGFSGHVEVVFLDGNSSFETQPITLNPELERGVAGVRNFKSMYPYAVKGGIIKTDEAMQGVMLKGVDEGYDWSFYESALVEGQIPYVTDSTRKNILISQSLSDMLRIGLGDRVEMLFVQGDGPPRRDRFKVAGIYKTGLEEMDRVMVMTDLRSVQKRNRWNDDQITGYEINTTDFGRLGQFEEDVRRVLVATDTPDDESLMSVTVEDLFPQLFDWLKAHDVNAAVIIAIMLAVALLNMISALLIILLERTRMIGELKSLGMNNRALQKMFVMRSAFIVLKGMVWGNVLGIGLCLLQKYTQFAKLDESGYFLSEVPVQLGVGWLAVLNIGAFVLIIALLVIPTSIISRIRPDKTIRYQ